MPRFTEKPFDYSDYFSKAIEFLHKYRWIYGSNNTKFVRDGVLDAFPREWINDLQTVSNEEFNHIPLGFIKDDWSPSFREFLLAVKRLQVQFDQHDSQRPEPRKGIGAKKGYEIENLCSFIETERCTSDPTMYIDFGCGLGYLSELIHQRCGLNVLGLEGNSDLVRTCQKRQADQDSASRVNAVQYCHHFITDDSFDFIRQEISNRFEDRPGRASITGLHACADLSITAINCFLRCAWAESLTIMPCCYHRMTLSEASPTGLCTFQNIPLSQELKDVLKGDKCAVICLPFLRLGCQQTATRWRERTLGEHLEHGRAMFRRALIDAALEEGEAVRVVKRKHIPEKATVENVLEQFTLQKQDPTPWTDNHRGKLATLLEKYGPQGPQLAEYLECLQTCLQSICESLILLDRMCYMEVEAERGGLQLRRNLVRLRDDGLSPRCFIFHARKLQ